jgi:chromatin remodeling complex protein RSC6
MATRRNESYPDVVQAEGPGPSVLIPYPGSTLPSVPLGVAPAVAKPPVAAEDDEEVGEDSDEEFDQDSDEGDADEDSQDDDSDVDDPDDDDDDDDDDDSDDEDDSDDDDSDDDDEDGEDGEDEDASAPPARSFMQPLTPSAALAVIVGAEPLPRVEVTKRVWAYIAKNKLQDPENKRFIKLDAVLKAVFGDLESINMFEMTAALARHLT